MKTKIIFNIFLLSVLFANAQFNFGLTAGSGFNKEINYSFKNIIKKSNYQFSYKAGIYCSYSLCNRINITMESNFFQKNCMVFEFKNSFNYIEIPTYFEIGRKKTKFSLGISNNIFLDANRYNSYSPYTLSILTGVSYHFSGRIATKLFYNRELTTHTSESLQNIDLYSYHQNLMLGLYINLLKI